MGLGGFAPLPIRLGGSPIKGLTARQHARLCATLVALVRSAKLAEITLYQLGSGHVPQVQSYNGQNGIGLAHAPTVSIPLASVGDYWLTFPNRWTDKYGNSHAVQIRRCRVSCGDTVARTSTWQVDAPNKVRIRTFTAAGVAVHTKTTVTVY